MLLHPQPLSRDHDVSSFDCGVESLNHWFSHHALQAHHAGSAKTFVVLTETGILAGYFSLTVGQIDVMEAPARIAKGMGQFPIPVILLARLAVDKRWQRKGVGGSMLREAVLKTLVLSENVGIRAILVHPLNNSAKEFYRKYGLIISPVREQQLLLLLKDAKKTFASNERG